MIKRKKKICKRCEKETYIFSEGLCLICYKITHPQKINKKSDKKIKEDKLYQVLRENYLRDNPFCEVKLEGCSGIATEIHHMKGRGKYYLEPKYFKAVCNHCHIIITENSKDAIENGYSQSRLKDDYGT